MKTFGFAFESIFFILITRWVGEAYRKTSKDEKFLRMLYRSFAKTGCLITADGSEDDKINPEGMPAYVVPPPVDIDNPVEITETPIPDEVKDNPINVLPDESDGEDEELDGQVEKSDGQEDEESGDEENKDPAEDRNIFDLFFN